MASLSSLVCVLVVAGTAIMTAESRVIHDRWFHTAHGYKYHVYWRRMSWQGAREYCQSIGGDLAVHMMKDYGYRVAIANIMLLKNEFTWIGLTDAKREGHWMWVDGTRAFPGTALWWGGEPNNTGGNEDCGGIMLQTNFKANDSRCSNWQYALCEAKI